jgi:hypothetical protein
MTYFPVRSIYSVSLYILVWMGNQLKNPWQTLNFLLLRRLYFFDHTGFLVREKIMESSDLKNKVFILLSHLKSEESIRRAVSLNIEHYFKKPYFPIELLGLIKNKLK